MGEPDVQESLGDLARRYRLVAICAFGSRAGEVAARVADKRVAAACPVSAVAWKDLLDLGRHIPAKGFGRAASKYRAVAYKLQEVGVSCR